MSPDGLWAPRTADTRNVVHLWGWSSSAGAMIRTAPTLDRPLIAGTGSVHGPSSAQALATSGPTRRAQYGATNSLTCSDSTRRRSLRMGLRGRHAASGKISHAWSFGRSGVGNHRTTQVYLRENVRPRRGLTSAPGCPKLAQACGEAGRR